ncbi:MAG TPA: amino acid permease [Bacteroidia bacterium]|jgi:APA family basic amino acid/polyamine antiporter|nr:amino acid permease [Bacteroidia bacterium]
MSESDSGIKRTLGLLDATSIVAGSMIGSGIFVVTTFMAQDVGSSGYLLLLWIITGLITVSAALSYGELAGMMPNAGGQYVYIRRAFSPLFAFLYGWTVFMVIQTGVIAAVATVFANYTAVFFPELKTVLFHAGSFVFTCKQVLAIVIILGLTWVNSRGVRNGKLIQLVFTSAKLIALLALIVLGFAIGFRGHILADNLSHLWDATRTWFDKSSGTWKTESITGTALLLVMGATIINSLFSSDAWNNVTFIAAEIKDPKKNIPRSLFLGTFIVTIIYILANVAYLALLPLHGNPAGTDAMSRGITFAADDRVGAAAASVIFGQTGTNLMAGLIMISTFGCMNGIILAGARLYYAMAKDGLFFKKAAALNKREVPAFGLWIQGVWACVLCLSGTYNDLLEYSTFASLLFYVLTISGIFILRKKEPEAERPYKALGYPVVPVLYILVTLSICAALLYNAKSSGNALAGLLLVGAGIPVYFFVKPSETKK